jgi:hypothetical protein
MPASKTPFAARASVLLAVLALTTHDGLAQPSVQGSLAAPSGYVNLPPTVKQALEMLRATGIIPEVDTLDIRMIQQRSVSDAAAFVVGTFPRIYIVEPSRNYQRAAHGSKDDLLILASQIAHEYHHMFTKSRNEVSAYDFQILTLTKLNAPKRLIDDVRCVKLKVTKNG